jgi:hypothetical protein
MKKLFIGTSLLIIYTSAAAGFKCEDVPVAAIKEAFFTEIAKDGEALGILCYVGSNSNKECPADGENIYVEQWAQFVKQTKFSVAANNVMQENLDDGYRCRYQFKINYQISSSHRPIDTNDAFISQTLVIKTNGSSIWVEPNNWRDLNTRDFSVDLKLLQNPNLSEVERSATAPLLHAQTFRRRVLLAGLFGENNTVWSAPTKKYLNRSVDERFYQVFEDNPKILYEFFDKKIRP